MNNPSKHLLKRRQQLARRKARKIQFANAKNEAQPPSGARHTRARTVRRKALRDLLKARSQ